MSITAFASIVMTNAHVIAVTVIPASKSDYSTGNAQDRRASGRSVIDSVMSFQIRSIG